MTKTSTILGFSIVLALVIGIVSSGSIVEAVKPLTEMIIANDETNPIPVTIENFPTPSSEVLVANTEPIEVTGISSSPVCPADKVQHWSTFIVIPTKEIKHDAKININGEITIDIPTPDGIVVQQELAIKAAERLNSLGYYVEDPTKRDVKDTDFSSPTVNNIKNISVICAES